MIKSHWKLVWKTFKRAVVVTITTAFRQIKLFNSLVAFEPKLRKRRKFIEEQWNKQ